MLHALTLRLAVFGSAHLPRNLINRVITRGGSSRLGSSTIFTLHTHTRLHTSSCDLPAARAAQRSMAPTQEAKRLRKGAGKGNPLQQFQDALLLYQGREGVKQDFTTAAEWARSSATQGLAAAQYLIANMYKHGEGVERDMEQAMAWSRKAASQDPENCDVDDEHHRQSHRRGILLSRRNLALSYKSGTDVAQDFDLAAEWFQKAADGGCVESRVDLGAMYYHGDGVEQDYERAVAELRQVAEVAGALGEEEGGCVSSAQCSLAHCYFCGHGVEKDAVMALALYQKAAMQGNKEAMLAAATMCVVGQGGEVDVAYGFKMFHKLAKDEEFHRQCEAQNELGYMYLRGQCVAQDYTKAMEWFSKSAANGCVNAQVNLALHHLHGWGVERDVFEAGRLFLSPASKGHIHAQWELGEIFRKGELYCGRKMDLARKYIKLAAAQGCDKSSTCSECYGCFAVARLAEMRRDKVRCLRCGAGSTHYKCAMCRDARYCSRECSAAHWTHGGGFDSTLGGTEEPHQETCARTHSRSATSSSSAED